VHTVIETPAFIAAARGEDVPEATIRRLISRLARDPEAGDVIQGTGGCRKVRMAGRGKGKSGGYRVITFYTGRGLPLFLLTLFGKDSMENLSRSERNDLKDLTKILVDQYRNRR
jgi:hypothetical protein